MHPVPRSAVRLVLAAACVVAMMTVTATPASASILFRDRYTDSYTNDFSACGTSVHLAGSVSGTFLVRQHGDKMVPYVLDHFDQLTYYTNLATNRTFSAELRVDHADVHISLVSGTVYEFTWQDASIFTVRDQDGRPVYHVSGLMRTTALVDTKGDLDLDNDVWISGDTTTRGHVVGADFCTDLIALTTG